MRFFQNKRKMILFFLVGLLVIAIAIFLYLFVGSAPVAKEISWGVNFSQKHTQNFGLDWKEAYEAILDDLGAKRLKIAVHWDFIEPEKDTFQFDDLDWQMQEAEKRNAAVLLVIGMKTPRWPECHIPGWAKEIGKEAQQQEILSMLETVVLRYKDSPAVWAWQVENEPFFAFGECPWADIDFVKKEVALVKSLDSEHSILISDSGEGSFWFNAARVGDIVGTTLYRKVWFHQIGMYVSYPFPPVFYWRKAQLIDFFFGKEVIGVELQTEPWAPKLLYDASLEEQRKTMNLEQFKSNIDYAKRTGLKEFYLWGAEWWYWMKTNHPDDPNAQIWEEAKQLF